MHDCSLPPPSLRPHSAQPRTLPSSGPKWCFNDTVCLTSLFPREAVPLSICSCMHDTSQISFRQKSLNLPTHYTILVCCASTRKKMSEKSEGKKVGEAGRIYAFMLTNSESIISLNFGNCCFSWFVYSQTAKKTIFSI